MTIADLIQGLEGYPLDAQVKFNTPNQTDLEILAIHGDLACASPVVNVDLGTVDDYSGYVIGKK